MRKITTILMTLLLSCTFIFAQDAYEGRMQKQSFTDRPVLTSPILDSAPEGVREGTFTGATEDFWDQVFAYDIETTSGVSGLAGIETDGTTIYATAWDASISHSMCKFDLATGAFIETIELPHGGTRDMAWDGQYLYGGAASSPIYIFDVDGNSQGTISFSGDGGRAIAYNDDADAFYTNNWSSNILLIDRTGATTGTITGVPSIYGLAYDNKADDGPWLWLNAGTTTGGGSWAEQWDPATGMPTGNQYDIEVGGLSGGCATYEKDGMFYYLTCAQGTFAYGLEMYTLVTYTNDVGISSITSPVTGVNLTNAEEVTVNIKNYGTASQSGFEIGFSLDGTPVETTTYNETISGGEVVSYTFATTVDLSAYGDYTIEAWTALSGDENTGNDMKASTVTCMEPFYCESYSNNYNYEYIDAVTFGGIDNPSAGSYYTDYTSTVAPAVIGLGETKELGVSIYSDGSEYIYAWFDWNKNYVWDDDELVIVAEDVDPSGFYYADVTCPNNAMPGVTTFRVVDKWNSAPGPCENYSYGETEDYAVDIGGTPVLADVGVTEIMIPAIVTPGTFTPKAEVKNFGMNAQTFNVTLDNGTYTSTKTVTDLAAYATAEVTFDDWNAALGQYTFDACTDLTGDENPDNDCAQVMVSVEDLTLAYGYLAYDPTAVYGEGPMTFFLQTPDVINFLAPTTSDYFIGSGAYGMDTWFGRSYYDGTVGGTLYTIDPATGALTTVGNQLTNLNGLAWDYTSNTLYGVSANTLYTVDVTTGALTMVGTTSMTTAINLACDASGNLYSVDISDDNLSMIDKNSGASTIIGAVGFNASYAQDMEFTPGGELYMAAYNYDGGGELRTVDPATGATTLKGYFYGDGEVCGFAVPGAPGPVVGFQCDVMVADAGGRSGNTVTFGTHPDATDGIDEALGELELPPAPPAGVFDTRLVFPDGTTSSLIDLRMDGQEEITWTVKFQPGADGYPITLTWNPDNLPEGSFVMKDALTGTLVNVNMKAEDMATVTNAALTSLVIEYTQQITVNCPAMGGWNMVSCPVDMDDMSVANIFPDAASNVFAFDNGYTTVTDLLTGDGYWVKFDDATSHDMTGMPVMTPVAIAEGWNMIGGYEYDVTVSGITTDPAGLLASNFFGFGATGYFNPTDLVPGQGYWIKSSGDGVMMFNMTKKSPVEVNNTAAFFEIAIAATDGNASYDMMVGIDPEATDGIDADLMEAELPPAPPAGIFDSRMVFLDGVTSSLYDFRTGDINMNGTVTHKIQWQLGTGTEFIATIAIPEVTGTIEMTVQDPFGGAIVSETIMDGETTPVVVTNAALTSLDVTIVYTAPIPVEFTTFAANVAGEKVELTWETATETNNKGFEVERSSDDVSFTSIGFVDGNGTSAEAHSYSFVDHHATSGTYYYRLKQVDFDGTYAYSNTVEVDFVPTEFSLGQNYPNPFNPTTKIKFALPVAAKVSVKVYNVVGQQVAELINGQFELGLHEVSFNASQLSSGVYFYTIEAAGVDGQSFGTTKKMMLMK